MRFDGAPIEPGRLDAIKRALAHRGPDGDGVDLYPADGRGPSAALVHTRLSVVDLMGGRQPMKVPAVNQCGELALVFNGEIYNHRPLRKRLERRGHQFLSSHCDTEVLLHGYREWGTELPKHLHGMFAFAVWDAGQRSLFLCRDRAGKKPLYLHRDGNALTFASIVRAVVAGLDRRPDLDADALTRYLTFGYTFGRSLDRGVEEVPAAHWMLVEPDGRTTSQSYWQPPPLSRTSTRLGADRAVEELLTEAVADRLEADVPLGCFLSGGIDSSLIAAIAQRALGRDRPLKTFSVAMPDARYDESEHARRVAQHIGAEHQTLEARGDLETDLQDLIQLAGEPIGDSSLLPTYWLSRAARQHVTVALSGDGGDELFGGYDRYRAMRMIHRWRGPLALAPTFGRQFGPARSALTRAARLAAAARQSPQSCQYLDIVRLFTPSQLGELHAPTAGAVDALEGWVDEADPAEAARRWDMSHYLPYDLLRKVDRAAMAVALEVRCPMLDTQVYDLAGHLPLAVLTPGGRPKGLLRRLAESYLPPEITRRPKMGFAIPLGQWFAHDAANLLRCRLLEGPGLADLGFDRAAIERMIDHHRAGRADHSQRLFALLALAIWAEA